ncbi:EMC3/TMCO1 family protein [Candidatus Woesearchaeota archaeon]|nr:EMC3/TMCO1 family protein [Candidatus Woesearchaeota archaeon]MCF7901361.1 EMC3/TMCO1 family protein [Candidatus Woesearchaeota archaeon]MCF8013361.1 EMC3/TMCO1 family protein [Candidatus Woesearchaeota archaeon]
MVLDAILSLDYWILIFLLSLIVTLISTITYKYTTDQKKIKQYRKEVKDMQAEMKKHKDDQKKMLKIQREMMSKNGELMKQSFKPMLYTFIPLLLILSWMSSTLAYEPLQPNIPFSVTAQLDELYMANLSDITIKSDKPIKMKEDIEFQAEGKQKRWILQANESGTYTLLFEGDSFKETKEILVTTEKKFKQPIQTYKGQLKSVTTSNKEVTMDFGIFKLNWLWSYILLSVIMSIGLRKVMGVA